jgi:hypothetical protein
MKIKVTICLFNLIHLAIILYVVFVCLQQTIHWQEEISLVFRMDSRAQKILICLLLGARTIDYQIFETSPTPISSLKNVHVPP